LAVALTGGAVLIGILDIIFGSNGSGSSSYLSSSCNYGPTFAG
jgi:hypothetical protein